MPDLLAATTSVVMAAADEVSTTGIAGWSSFGLAGLILAWLLLKHLPEKDRQLDAKDKAHEARIDVLVKMHDNRIEMLAGAYEASVKDLASSFTTRQNILREDNRMILEAVRADSKEGLRMVLEHSRQQTEALGKLIAREMETLSDAVQALNVSIVDRARTEQR